MKIFLSEEEYMTRLGSILKRDFFPILQNDFSPPEQLDITEFQKLYTTEDNASFEELLARENERKRKKFERIYGGPAELVDNPSQRLLLKPTEFDDWKYKAKGPKSETRKLKWNDLNDSKRPQINLSNTRFKNQNEPVTSLSTATANKFKIQDTPAREQLAHSLTSTPSTPFRSTPKRVQKNRKSPSTPHKYSMKDLKGLTPSRKK